jgi:hypothetical protein
MAEQSRQRETHGMANVATGVRLHYVESGRGELTVVLLHGFPQTGAGIGSPRRIRRFL